MKTVVFFATPQELTAWVDEWRGKFGLQVGVVAFQPRFELTPLAEGAYLDSIWKPSDAGGSRLEEVWLSVDPLIAAGSTAAQIRSENRDSLIIRLPKLTASSVREASAGTVAQNPDRLKTWKKVVSDLKKQKTQAGMWVFNREMRVKGFYKEKLYSPGTVDAIKQGVHLTNLTGLEVSIDEPQIVNKGRELA